MTAENLLPPPAPDGSYRYPDGSTVRPSGPGRWTARWAPKPGSPGGTDPMSRTLGVPLRDYDRYGDVETVSVFDSPGAAAEALAAGGDGPGRRPTPEDRTVDAEVIRRANDAARLILTTPPTGEAWAATPGALIPAAVTVAQAWEAGRNENHRPADEFADRGTLKHFLLGQGYTPDNEEVARTILVHILREYDRLQAENL